MNARFLADLRYAASPPPPLEGSPKEVEEAWCQWYLEKSFFRDFVYRNPGGRRSGSELADAVVLFDDVALGVQVKAQRSDKDSAARVKKEGKHALKQLSGTMRMLRNRLVTRLTHEWYGSVEIHPEKYVSHFGLVILGTDVEPFDAYQWFPELGVLPFAGDVLTLHDLELAITHFDTALDFITYLEMRRDARETVPILVSDEVANLRRIAQVAPKVLAAHMPKTPSRVLAKSVDTFVAKATGALRSSPDAAFGMLIDDMIAHAHDIDIELSYATRQGKAVAFGVAEYLGCLTRERRIALGRIAFEKVKAARDRQDHYFCHYQRSRSAAFVFLATGRSREERSRILRALTLAAHSKHRAARTLGAATGPPARGRSYDFALVEGKLSESALSELGEPPDVFGPTVCLF